MAESTTELLEREHREISQLFDRIRSPEEDRAAALRQLVLRLTTHVAVEQAIVLPELRHSGAKDTILERELKHDYQAIGHDLLRIERRKANSPDQPELVTETHQLFRSHVGHCQERLYPDLEQSLNPHQSEELAKRMTAAGDVVASHLHPHLLSLGPFSRMTTRIAARLDHARSVGEWGGLFSAPNDKSAAQSRVVRRSGTTSTSRRSN